MDSRANLLSVLYILEFIGESIIYNSIKIQEFYIQIVDCNADYAESSGENRRFVQYA